MRCPQYVRGRFVQARNGTLPSRSAEPRGAAIAATEPAATVPPAVAAPAAVAIASVDAQKTRETGLMITRRS
jgi:hypothetical protein